MKIAGRSEPLTAMTRNDPPAGKPRHAGSLARLAGAVVAAAPAAYDEGVPRYEYRCRACGDTFEQTRPMSQSSDPAACPQGHDDTVKLLSTVAVGGRAGSAPAPQAGGGGGCCGGACGCG